MKDRYYVKPEYGFMCVGNGYYQVMDSLTGRYVKGVLWRDEADSLCARLNSQEVGNAKS